MLKVKRRELLNNWKVISWDLIEYIDEMASVPHRIEIFEKLVTQFQKEAFKFLIDPSLPATVYFGIVRNVPDIIGMPICFKEPWYGQIVGVHTKPEKLEVYLFWLIAELLNAYYGYEDRLKEYDETYPEIRIMSFYDLRLFIDRYYQANNSEEVSLEGLQLITNLNSILAYSLCKRTTKTVSALKRYKRWLTLPNKFYDADKIVNDWAALWPVKRLFDPYHWDIIHTPDDYAYNQWGASPLQLAKAAQVIRNLENKLHDENLLEKAAIKTKDLLQEANEEIAKRGSVKEPPKNIVLVGDDFEFDFDYEVKDFEN